ncbi:hypothetical protein G3M48_008304 [Beauveria asiatica]|uniref:DUF7580 domain-containing protein n=1 Tax=Beauveria asiatica TaxID=1069075 RepID=A0AAW0RLA7_9HYPO
MKQFAGQHRELHIIAKQHQLLGAWLLSPIGKPEKQSLDEAIAKGYFKPLTYSSYYNKLSIPHHTLGEKRALAVNLGYCLMDFFDSDLDSDNFHFLVLIMALKTHEYGQIIRIRPGQRTQCNDSYLEALLGCLNLHTQLYSIDASTPEGDDLIRKELHYHVVQKLEFALEECTKSIKSKWERSLSPPASNARGQSNSQNSHGKPRKRVQLREFDQATLSYALLEQVQADNEEYKYPGTASDRLFHASYRHKHQRQEQCACYANCRRSSDLVCETSRGLSCHELKCHDEHLVARERLDRKR